MKATEMRGKTREALNQELVELKGELFKLRFQPATNQLSPPNQLKFVKRNIARVLTVIREQELGAKGGKH